MNANENPGEGSLPEPVDPRIVSRLTDDLTSALEQKAFPRIESTSAVVAMVITSVLQDRDIPTPETSFEEIDKAKIPDELKDLFTLYLRAVAETKANHKKLMDWIKNREAGENN